jgi:carbamoyl-phosphate synthase large subunit
MPTLDHVKKVMLVGPGGNGNGDACEFEFSSSQASRALRNLGYKTILVDSCLPGMASDPENSDVTYVEPVTIESVSRIIQKEKPDAILATLAGQRGLYLCSELARHGILEKYGVRLMGLQERKIEWLRGRIGFMDGLRQLGIDVPKSLPAFSSREAGIIASRLGYPLFVRSAYSCNNSISGLAYNLEELQLLATQAHTESFIGQIVVEETGIGLDEFEVEVMRDCNNQRITVCCVERIVAKGAKSCDFCSVIPALTISAELRERIERCAHQVVEALGVVGSTNVQLAYEPGTGRVIVIEVSPWSTRTSALASKATGLPIPFVSTLLAGGLTLKEIPYWRTGSLDQYAAPDGHVTVGLTRLTAQTLKGPDRPVGTGMRVISEVMGLGNSFKEALQKAIRSLETDQYGLGFSSDYFEKDVDDLMDILADASGEQLFILYEALRKGAPGGELHRRSRIKPWFITQIKELVELEKEILAYSGKDLPQNLLHRAKRDGFSDRYLAELLKVDEAEIRNKRLTSGCTKTLQAIRVSSDQDAAYYYSTYCPSDAAYEGPGNSRSKIMVIGSGPYRIGQSCELDYCCTQSIRALQNDNIETIMFNSNPGALSTDYYISDRVYIEPVCLEDILEVCERERPDGVIIRFGGSTPAKIAGELAEAGVKIIGNGGASAAQIEGSDLFRIAEEQGIPFIQSQKATSFDEVAQIAENIGYPVVIEAFDTEEPPIFEDIPDAEGLCAFMSGRVGDGPVFLRKSFDYVLYAEAVVISDGIRVFVPAVVEILELAGVHLGEPSSITPPLSIPADGTKLIKEYAVKVAEVLGYIGIVNLQFIIADNTVYLHKSNSDVYRMTLLISKVYNYPMIGQATRALIGKPIDPDLNTNSMNYFGVSGAVFPFNMIPAAEPYFHIEPRAATNVLGIAEDFGLAFYKAQESAKYTLPLNGTILITVSDLDKDDILRVAKRFEGLGFNIKSTQGTFRFLKEQGLNCHKIFKIHEGRPNIVDEMVNGKVQLIINCVCGKLSRQDDFHIRKAAIKYRIPCITTISAAIAAVNGIEALLRSSEKELKPLRDYNFSMHGGSTPARG